jgi:hypothetical protein
MKKLLLTAVTLVALSTASFADQNTENMNAMAAKRAHHFMMMTQAMMKHEMAMLKQQEAMLNNYQKQLKQMLDNDMGSHQ